MNYKPVIIIFCFLFVTPLLAHEFWLQPLQFLYTTGDEINIRFYVGKRFTGNNWKGSVQKVHELKFYYADVQDDLSDALADEEGDSLQFSLFEGGTAMVTFNSVNSSIELNAEDFNAYLEEDGLSDALEYRKQHNELDSSAKELYQRSVKTIVQVGTVKTDIYKKQTNLPLDIIPLSHPYTIINGQQIKMKVLFMGKPLASTKVKIWQRIAGVVKDSAFITNENGEFSFPVETIGEWMVSCVHMVRQTDTSSAHPIVTGWQSYWGSVTWGYTGKTGTRISNR